MAPEIHIGEPYSREADLWSLGLYVYERRVEINILSFVQDASSMNSAAWDPHLQEVIIRW